MKSYLRVAETSDAEAMASCHFSAVHQSASHFYSTDILRQWSPLLSAKRINQFKDAIVSNDEWIIVATVAGSVVGFGSITPGKNELTAAYVHPSAAGKGIGKSIVNCLENRARDLELDYLQIDASINAVPFYERCGFRMLSLSTHALGSGEDMQCMVMEKSLL